VEELRVDLLALREIRCEVFAISGIVKYVYCVVDFVKNNNGFLVALCVKVKKASEFIKRGSDRRTDNQGLGRSLFLAARGFLQVEDVAQALSIIRNGAKSSRSLAILL
jgi:hypothetical protein